MALQVLSDLRLLPLVVAKELLQSADGTTRGQRDGLGGLAFEVGEEPATVGVQVGEGLGVTTTEEIGPQEGIQGRPQTVQLLLGHCSGLLGGLLLSYRFSYRLTGTRSAVLLTSL